MTPRVRFKTRAPLQKPHCQDVIHQLTPLENDPDFDPEVLPQFKLGRTDHGWGVII